MNAGYLMLYPTGEHPLPTVSTLVTRLETAGLIGRPLARTPHHFLTGAQFLQRISFLGCSPNLPLGGNGLDDNTVCSIRILGPYASVRLLTGHNSRPPRCPACRQPLPEWRDHIATPNKEIHCPACGQVESLAAFNWRQLGAAARLFIAISQVFPGEAVPTAGLMDMLQSEGGEWDYFYVQPPLLGLVGEEGEL